MLLGASLPRWLPCPCRLDLRRPVHCHSIGIPALRRSYAMNSMPDTSTISVDSLVEASGQLWLRHFDICTVRVLYPRDIESVEEFWPPPQSVKVLVPATRPSLG